MHTIQRNAGTVPSTKIVYYKDNGVGEALKPGYALCYDIAEDLTPQGEEFGEMVRGIVVIKPATANLEFFAGIVKKVHQRLDNGIGSTDYSGFVEVYEPKYGTFVDAFCGANIVVTEPLVPVDGQWWLVPAATTDIAQDWPIAGVGQAAVTDATLTATPANALVMLRK